MKLLTFFISLLAILGMPEMQTAPSIRKAFASRQQDYDQDFKITRLRHYPVARRGVLLNNGVIVFHFEEIRSPTEEEKSKRASYFEKEWMELEKKSKESIPEMEKTVEKGAKEAEKKVKEKPFLMPLSPFFSIVPKFFSGVLKMGVEIAKTEGKRHFVNQPVVTNAGFIFDYPGGKEEKFFLLLEEIYGPEEWMRMPYDAVNIQASRSGRFLGLETEKGGILLFEYDQKAGELLPLGRVEGRHPFGFSCDDKYMFVTLEEGLYRIDILPPPGWREKRYFISPHRAFKNIKVEIKKQDFIKDVILHDNYLFLLTARKLYVYDIIDEKINKEYTFGGYGGGSLTLGPSGDLFVANMDRATVSRVNLKNWGVSNFIKENWIDLERKHKVKFFKLVSISPDERYVAALYDPGLIPPPNAKSWSGSTTGESRLFIWDVTERKVVFKLNERLEDITGGFGYQSPAYFTDDWSYVLVITKENGIELMGLRR